MAQHDSHPICPTCQSDLTCREKLERFCGESLALVTNDGVITLYEETNTLVRLLGALAQAAPLAIAQYASEIQGSPQWDYDLSRLAEELAAETQRRLELLRKAGLIWQERAEVKGS
jgi:hypothetical protein